MIPESLIDSPLLAGLAITLIHFIWQGVLVAGVLKVLLSFISFQKSQLRYALSSMAMLACLLLPLMTFFIVYDSDYRQATSVVNALPLLEQSYYLEQLQANAWYIEWLEYLPSVAMIWLSIVIMLTIKLLIQLYNVNKLPLQGCTAADLALQKRFDTLINKVGLSRKVALLLSNKTDVPMAIGWLKPVVLMPVSMMSGLTPQQLDMLLLHELAHIRRHDYLVNFLQTLVEILLFFHPAVHWVSKQMRNEREYCSDDIAVHHCGNSLAYAHTLADTASLCEKHRQHSIPTMAMAASGGDLKQRVVRLLDTQQHCTNTTDSGKWLASLTILLAIALLFSKQSLTLPTIDLQSGSISLNSPVKELTNNASLPLTVSIEQVKTNSTLAGRLLAINNTKNAKPNTLSQTNVASKSDNKRDIKSNIITETSRADIPADINKKPTNAYYEELPFVSVKATKIEDSKLIEMDLETAKASGAASKLVKSKSISDIAFERTDSKKNLTNNNSYAKQVSSLLDEPAMRKSGHNTTLNKTYYRSSNALASTTTKQHINDFSQGKLDKTFQPEKPTQYRPVAAQLLNSVDPKYPSAAKRKGIELEIMVEFSIDKNGLVKDIQFESKSKVSYFRSTIRNAMEKWRFLPAKENGRTVESEMSKIFSFSLLK